MYIFLVQSSWSHYVTEAPYWSFGLSGSLESGSARILAFAHFLWNMNICHNERQANKWKWEFCHYSFFGVHFLLHKLGAVHTVKFLHAIVYTGAQHHKARSAQIVLFMQKPRAISVMWIWGKIQLCLWKWLLAPCVQSGIIRQRDLMV